jgi:hypothetical protein
VPILRTVNNADRQDLQEALRKAAAELAKVAGRNAMVRFLEKVIERSEKGPLIEAVLEPLNPAWPKIPFGMGFIIGVMVQHNAMRRTRAVDAVEDGAQRLKTP